MRGALARAGAPFLGLGRCVVSYGLGVPNGPPPTGDAEVTLEDVTILRVDVVDLLDLDDDENV